MKPHKHAELIKAWADGAEIEEKYTGLEENRWYEFSGYWDADEYEYRIKPEPKPDIEKYFVLEPITNDYGWVFKEFWAAIPAKAPAITCVFDGETGELKSAEVLK